MHETNRAQQQSTTQNARNLRERSRDAPPIPPRRRAVQSSDVGTPPHSPRRHTNQLYISPNAQAAMSNPRTTPRDLNQRISNNVMAGSPKAVMNPKLYSSSPRSNSVSALSSSPRAFGSHMPQPSSPRGRPGYDSAKHIMSSAAHQSKPPVIPPRAMSQDRTSSAVIVMSSSDVTNKQSARAGSTQPAMPSSAAAHVSGQSVPVNVALSNLSMNNVEAFAKQSHPSSSSLESQKQSWGTANVQRSMKTVPADLSTFHTSEESLDRFSTHAFDGGEDASVTSTTTAQSFKVEGVGQKSWSGGGVLRQNSTPDASGYNTVNLQLQGGNQRPQQGHNFMSQGHTVSQQQLADTTTNVTAVPQNLGNFQNIVSSSRGHVQGQQRNFAPLSVAAKEHQDVTRQPVAFAQNGLALNFSQNMPVTYHQQASTGDRQTTQNSNALVKPAQPSQHTAQQGFVGPTRGNSNNPLQLAFNSSQHQSSPRRPMLGSTSSQNSSSSSQYSAGAATGGGGGAAVSYEQNAGQFPLYTTTTAAAASDTQQQQGVFVAGATRPKLPLRGDMSADGYFDASQGNLPSSPQRTNPRSSSVPKRPNLDFAPNRARNANSPQVWGGQLPPNHESRRDAFTPSSLTSSANFNSPQRTVNMTPVAGASNNAQQMPGQQLQQQPQPSYPHPSLRTPTPTHAMNGPPQLGLGHGFSSHTPSSNNTLNSSASGSDIHYSSPDSPGSFSLPG